MQICSSSLRLPRRNVSDLWQTGDNIVCNYGREDRKIHDPALEMISPTVHRSNSNNNLKSSEPLAIDENNPEVTMPRSKNATKQAEVTHVPQAREPKTRNRPIKACFPCRYSKGKCDQARPRCSRCEEHNLDCQYLPTNLTPQQLAELNELKQTDRNIQKRRTVLAVGKPSGKAVQRVREWFNSNDGSSSEESMSGPEDEFFPRINGNAVVDAPYDDDASDEDPILDMGFKMGKVGVNDRIGTYQRPNADQEVSSPVRFGIDRGPRVVACQLISAQLDFVLSSPMLDRRTPEEKAENPGIPHVEEYYEPIPDGTSYCFQPGDTYIAPISGFPFSDGLGDETHRPTRELADILMKQYWTCVHPITRTIHKPSFERAYCMFWAGGRTPTSTRALIFAAMFSAVVSMPKDHPILHQIRDEEGNLLEKFQSSTEALLGRAHLARTTKLETIQAAVTYLVSKGLSLHRCENTLQSQHWS